MQNETGLRPIDYNVLLKQEKPAEKTEGGLYLTDTAIDRQNFSETRGMIVAISPMAFTYEDWPEGEQKPQVGDWVRFAKHEGDILQSSAGEEYRMVKDRSILAVEESTV